MDSLGNLQQLFQLGQQMQTRMADLNDRLEKETLSATSGGGMVEVSADGRGNVRRLKLDPAVVDPEDVEMLEDLILAAISEVQRRARGVRNLVKLYLIGRHGPRGAAAVK